MINISRPIDIFSFHLLQDFQFKNQTLKSGRIQLKRDTPLSNGDKNPNILVFTDNDFYKNHILVVNDKFVKEILKFVKFRQLESGDYGDYGNEDMK